MDIAALTQRAESGSTAAQATLGIYYLHGVEPLATDYDKAFRFLSMAAAQGASRAIANLGDMYANGLGVAQDVKKAIQLYEQVGAVEFFAALELARIYANTDGTFADSKKAIAWYSVVVAFADTEAFDYDALQQEILEARAYLDRFSNKRDGSSYNR